MANPFTSKTVGTSALDFLAPDVAQDQRRLDRRQQLADLLLAQSVQPSETGTQTVGGWAIPNNQIKPFEKLGMALLSNRSQSRIDEQRADIAKRYAEALSKGMAGTGGSAEGPSMNQALAMSALGLNVPPKVVERIFGVVEKTPVNVDVGGKILRGSFDPSTGETTVAGEFEKSATPDAVMRDDTTRRGQDMTQSTALRGQDVTMRGQDMTQGTAIRGQDLQADTSRRGQDMTAQTALTLGGPDVKAAQTAATEQARAEVERGEKQRALDSAFVTYETAIKGLVEGLDAATTGPLAGRIPAMSSGAQKAEGAVAAMAPVLKDLFRSAGEGVFTDRDQALLLEMIPQRTDTPEARRFKLDNIDRIVRAKLKQGASAPIFNFDQMPANSAEDPLGLR